jgi:dienelactone hydrolase
MSATFAPLEGKNRFTQRRHAVLLLATLLCQPLLAQDAQPLPGTKPLEGNEGLSEQMVAGIGRFLLRQTERAASQRGRLWRRDFASPQAYEESIQTNRESLRKMIGAVDPRLAVNALEFVASSAQPAQLAQGEHFTITAVRWPVFEGVFGEGLWLRPKAASLARVVAIPDADQTPELIAGLAPGLPPERQFARRLAENGCEVLVPVLVDRTNTWSGSARLQRFTNQPHREWIYRQAFIAGRHIIAYEVQKILAAVDFFSLQTAPEPGARPKIAVAGYEEGGLIAFYAAALDQRIDAALVSGYFDSRQQLWQEPVYRNVFGLLGEFSDAEIATLVAPRALIIEYSPIRLVDGPPKPQPGRSGAAPGKLSTPDYQSVENEFERARRLLQSGGSEKFDHLNIICGTEGMATDPLSDPAVLALLNALGAQVKTLKPAGNPLVALRNGLDTASRQQRQVKELEEHTQRIARQSEQVRANFLWNAVQASAAQEWEKVCVPFRHIFREQVIGHFDIPILPANPRSRRILDRPKWTGYEIMLDVYPDVFAWGYLLLPKDLKPDERRPVVVCQHGLEGVPADVVNEDAQSGPYRYYKAFAARLAERGFIVFAPHNPYRGGDRFRQLQRLANPLGKSLFSIITAQHECILDWLSQQPFVDPQRIAFYGLSYGGKTAMRVPAIVDRYALSICSGDFNDWVRKNISVDFPASYMFMGEYEMPEFNLASTFNYAEMAALIAPRPFMVERGHNDGVGIDEWIAYEYAKVRRLYARLGIPERTQIEFFLGDHTLNGVGTFEFLHEHLGWPKPEN